MLRAALRSRTLAAVPRGAGLSLLRRAIVPAPRFCSGRPADDGSEPVLLYEGAKNKIVKTIKMVSIANLGFAIGACPVLHYVTSMAGSPGKGIAMSGLVCRTGLSPSPSLVADRWRCRAGRWSVARRRSTVWSICGANLKTTTDGPTNSVLSNGATRTVCPTSRRVRPATAGQMTGGGVRDHSV